MMEDWLQHPAVQSAAVPFVVALAVAAPLRNGRFAGLGAAAAMVALVALTIGFALEPLTATRKMLLVGLGCVVTGVALDLRAVAATPACRALLWAASGAAAVWVLLRVLLQREPAEAVLAGAAAAGYVAVLVESVQRLRASVLLAASSAVVLGLAAAMLAFIGASAWLTQAGVALAAGAGAVGLAARTALGPAGWTLLLPATVAAALINLLAAFTGELAWWGVLPPLAVPWLLEWLARRAPRTSILPSR